MPSRSAFPPSLPKQPGEKAQKKKALRGYDHFLNANKSEKGPHPVLHRMRAFSYPENPAARSISETNGHKKAAA